MYLRREGACDVVPIPKRYRYKPTPYKNYFKLIDPIITCDSWIITVTPPKRILLTELEIFGNEIDTENPKKCITSIPNLNIIQEHFIKEGRLEIKAALRIIRDAGLLIQKESTLLELNRPITIVGDISGQYYDLLTLLKLGGNLDRFKYLFLGHYVNGGYFGTECIIQLCTMKLNYPDNIFLLRGNHETRLMSELHLFKIECDLKYNTEFYEECLISLFNKLPLAALVENRFLCLHGGISPYICTLDDIRKINRFCEPELNTELFDMLWSDPIPDYDTNITSDCFENNTQRGVAYYYTYKGLKRFLKNNNLFCIIRGHEVKYDGFNCYTAGPDSTIPSLITVYSSPNYKDIYNNKGAILQYENCNFTIKQFSSKCHPYWFANFECALTLTLPFVAQKVTDILLALLKNCVEGGSEDMYMPMMRQKRDNAICCKHSIEFDKILDIKKKIRIICQISAFYSNIKNYKLNFIKLQPKKVKEEAEELEVIGRNINDIKKLNDKKREIPELYSNLILDDDTFYGI